MDFYRVFCDNTLTAGKPVCLTASGTSMWPLIRAGMKAQISPLEPGLPEIGALLLVRLESGLMVHRCWGVVDVEGTTFIKTKGDANLGFDRPVPIETILGRVSLLITDTGSCFDPGRGLLKLYGKLLCSSSSGAWYWARACRKLYYLMRLPDRIGKYFRNS